MPRKYKCLICSQYDYDDIMTTEKVGGVNKRIHKAECYAKYVKDQEFKTKEKKEWDDCYQTIKTVCDVEFIPQSFIGLIQRLRNGDPVIGMKKEDTKKFKQGFSYPTIAETYRRKSDIITWKKSQWDGSSGRFLQFVLTYYIQDIIEDVHKEIERKEEQKQIQEEKDLSQSYDYGLDTYNYKDKKDEQDISDML